MEMSHRSEVCVLTKAACDLLSVRRLAFRNVRGCY